MPDLAVIMSVYKKDKLRFVQESVESILKQTFSDFHYYLVIDGPVSDEIENYIYSLSDRRLFRFRLEKNGGLAGALNFLLEKVMKDPQYKFIARMDADDISMPGRFGKQRDFLIKNEEISCVGSWYEEMDEYGKHLAFRKLPTDNESLRRRYFTRTPFAHSSVMYRRRLIEKAGYYPVDTFHMEDNVLWGNVLKQGMKIANIPEFIFRFRIDDNFYRRRSGIKYSWNFIKTRMAINQLTKAPFYIIFFTIGIGVLKVFPSHFIKMFYRCFRN
jgi:glycosyltransferase involved in cell wall biosynthesis